MPREFDAQRRYHIPKMPFKVTNWAEYEAGLRQRGSLTLLDYGVGHRCLKRCAARDAGRTIDVFRQRGPSRLMLRSAFTLALRQAEGLMSSVIELLDCGLAVPDHTTVSLRAIELPSIARAALPVGPLHAVIDSTGLKSYGAGEWLADKHGRRAPRQYCKLHWHWTPIAARSWPSRPYPSHFPTGGNAVGARIGCSTG